MKKKLLTILLSIAVILTSTVTVFAKDTKKSGDIFNTVNDVNKWTNEHGAVFADLYDYNDLLNQDAESENGVIYRFSCGNENYALTIMNDKLFSIEVSNCPAETYNGTYTLTIASILPSNFPASAEDNSWCESVNGNVYIYKKDSNLVFNDKTDDCYSVPLSSSLTKEENPEVSYVYSVGETEIQFNMTGDNNDELKNIVVNKCTIFACVGTYAAPEAFSVTYDANGATSGTAPANQTKTAGVNLTLATNTGNLAKTGYTFDGWNTQANGEGDHYNAGAAYTTDAALTLYAEWTVASATKTIADILDKAVGGFPTSQSNAWKCSSSICVAYKLGNNDLFIVQPMAPSISINVNNNVLQISDSQYKYHNSTDNYDVLFNLVKDKLVSIEVTGISGNNSLLNGTYVKTLTIVDILSNNFPSTDLSGWGGSSTNTRLFLNPPDSLYINQQNGTDPYIISQNQTISYVTNNQYKYHNTESGKEFDIFFNLENGELKSIVITGATGDLTGINDTYTEPVKLADIIPSNFPKAEASAWTNGTHKIYLVDNEIKLNGTINVLNLDCAVRPVGNGDYHFTDYLGKLTFIMDGDKFTSIVASGFSSPYETANGTYSVPVTIESLLDAVVGGFPTSKNSGWLIDGDTNNYRAYIDGTYLKVAYGSVPLNSVLKKDGDSYKFDSSGPIYIFKMESNVLKSINYSVMGSGSGVYIPYKYEVKPTSPIPKGSTSNQVFETNGIYVDGEEANVEVKLDGQLLTLNTHYTLSHGSIKITLLGSYIKDLAPGTYTISIGVKDGISGYTYEPITSQFTITDSSPAPSPSSSSDTASGYKIPKTGIE